MKIFKKLLDKLHNASLNRKIVSLLLVVGVLPLGVAFTVSLAEIEKAAQQQEYVMNQGFTQVYQVVEVKLDRVRNISTLLAVNDMISQNIMLADKSGHIAEQLACFDEISAYINGMEMIFEPNNITFYVESGFSADVQTGRFQSMDVISRTDWYARLRANNGGLTWRRYQAPLSGVQYISAAREIWNPANYGQPIGVLALTFEQAGLEQMLVGSVESQIMYLETAGGMLLASNVPEEELVRVPLGARRLHDAGFPPRWWTAGGTWCAAG